MQATPCVDPPGIAPYIGLDLGKGPDLTFPWIGVVFSMSDRPATAGVAGRSPESQVDPQGASWYGSPTNSTWFRGQPA